MQFIEQEENGLSIPKIGINPSGSVTQWKASDGNSDMLHRHRMGSQDGSNTNLPTLASDSSPFLDKYDMDEELELLGEVIQKTHIYSFKKNIDTFILGNSHDCEGM